MTDRRLEVVVNRKAGERRYRETFEVPQFDNQTVLDVVSWIQQHRDATLSYRFACRVGMCGSCAMMVNGVPRWTCRTHVNKVTGGGRLEIAPLDNFPVVRDLVVDMDPFFDKWIAAGGVHHPTATRNDAIVPVDVESPERKAADAAIECINCGVCYAGCETVAGNEAYLGPAALQRVWTLVNDQKDGARQAKLDAVSGTGGCHNCHGIGSCSTYCPVGLDPMTALAGLKRETSKRFFKRRG